MIKLKLHLLLAKNDRMTQKELSKLTGIRPATISNYCNNTFKVINKEHLSKFIELFGCNLNDLIEYTK